MNKKSFIEFCNKIGLQEKLKYVYNDKENNILSQVEYMLLRSNIMFHYDGLPDSIPQHELEKILQTNGFAIIGKIDGELYALSGGLGGVQDVYYRPTQAIVSVPYLNFNATWEIGKDCIILKNDLLNIGLLPLYLRYCTQLVESDITLILELVNKRVQAYISASDDATIKSAEQFLTDVFNGKQGVIADSKFFEQVKTSIVNSGSYSMRETIEVIQYLKASLYNEIGLASNYNLKKERVTYADIEMNSDNLYPLIDDMLYFRRLGIDAINELFNTSIEVQLNSSWDYRSYNGMEIDNTSEKIDINETDFVKPDDEKPDDEKPDDEKPDDEKPDDEKPDDEEKEIDETGETEKSGKTEEIKEEIKEDDENKK